MAQTEKRRITKIALKGGAIVDSIAIAYSGSNAVRTEGGDCHATSTEWKGVIVELQPYEHVKTIAVKHGKLFVQRLCLTTNMGREVGPRGAGGTLLLGGKMGKETVVHAPEGCMLVGIHGRAGKYLNAIGFHWAPIAACYDEGDGVALNHSDLTSTALFGGKGGKAFDHGHFALP